MSVKPIQLGSATRRLAAVDVGTNTVRMLVADVGANHSIKPLASGREMVRLGEGLALSGQISEAAEARAMAALSGFAEEIGKYTPEAVAVAATSAVREAENGAEFVERVRHETGFELTVIDGGEEARLTGLGAASVLSGDLKRLLVVDIGGGSTEFLQLLDGIPGTRASVPMGVVTATEQFFCADPPGGRELYALDEYIRGHMASVRRALGEVGRVRLVATAGTPTTLAAMDLEMTDYDPAKINNHTMTLDRVEELFDRIVRVSASERRLIAGIEPGREELIVAGGAILLRVMHDYQFGVVSVSDSGLREGLILDLFHRVGG
ncbi:MAG: exopolyphosphatase [Leptospirillia bacterium]